MKIIKVVASAVLAASIFCGIRFYNMTNVSHISHKKISRPPEILAKDKILYFDDYNEEGLIRYREFLDRHGIGSIDDLNEKVLYITDLINRIHKIDNGTVAAKYPEYISIKGDTAYCQKSSILLTQMLSSISIYSRHWHASYQNNTGFHQFVEYYNPGEGRWIVIDPLYGIQYEKNGRLLSVDEIAEVVSEGHSVKEITNLLDIERLYYNPEEIENVWSRKMILARANDYIRYYEPETKYGIFGKMPYFNRLPSKAQKLFRIFGRDNSMYEVYNFKEQGLMK